jgi:hypothetical protein
VLAVADREACEKEAKAVWIKHTERCKLEDCHEQVENEMAPVFETCNALDTAAAREACLADAESKLKDLIEDRCYPEPTCLEQARAHYDETRAECDAMTNENEKETCYVEVERVYAEWT